jgi:hypothetical protein
MVLEGLPCCSMDDDGIVIGDNDVDDDDDDDEFQFSY